MALGAARFQKLRGAELSEGQIGVKFFEGNRFPRAAMFFCKRVVSVAILCLLFISLKMIENGSSILNLCCIRFFYILEVCKFI